MVKILSEFMNKDPLGNSFISLKIEKDFIVIEFPASESATPNIFTIQSNFSSLYGYLDKLGYLNSKITELS